MAQFYKLRHIYFKRRHKAMLERYGLRPSEYIAWKAVQGHWRTRV